jgi:hypothetical protein
MSDVKFDPLFLDCPYCNEEEFDLIGLKSHLINDCKEFAEIKTLSRFFGEYPGEADAQKS